MHDAKRIDLTIYIEQDLWDRCRGDGTAEGLQKKYLEPLAYEIRDKAVSAVFEKLIEPDPQYEMSESGIILNKTAATIMAPAAVLGGVLAWRENRMSQIKKEDTDEST